ncbi:MAG TPA: hypothetical protein VGG75_29900 [Trebonia sp.]|jgi:hypothetical protein
MAVEHAIVALLDHWDDVVSRLATAQNHELHTWVEKINGPEHDRSVAEIADLLVEELPPSHPVRRALADGHLAVPATIDWAALKSKLLERIAQTGTGQ